MRFGLLLSTLLMATPLQAEPANVIAVDLDRNDDGTYRIAVTISSDETGWGKYADLWEVLSPDGTVLATRILYHPHVEEQPFTRSLPAISIPDNTEEIHVRARDSVEGFGGAEMVVPVP